MRFKKNRAISYLLLILSIAIFQNANAIELVLQPDGAAGKDALIAVVQPDVNYGYSAQFSASRITRGLIEFDVSAVPDGAVITSATFEVLEYAGCDQDMNLVEIYLNSAAWLESTVTWNNAPAYGSSIGTNSGETTGCDWLVFDVSSAVQGWVDGPPNYGFRVGVASKGMRSSDHSIAAERPILRINYKIELPHLIFSDGFEVD
jgi:hypothetical protein